MKRLFVFLIGLTVWSCQFVFAQSSDCCSPQCLGCCCKKIIEADSSTVKMMVSPSVVKLPMTEDSLPWLIIENNSDYTIEYGSMYQVEYYSMKLKKWVEPLKRRGSFGAAFELIRLSARPHSKEKHALGSYYYHYRFIPGKYRIVKKIESNKKESVLYAEFAIQGGKKYVK